MWLSKKRNYWRGHFDGGERGLIYIYDKELLK